MAKAGYSTAYFLRLAAVPSVTLSDALLTRPLSLALPRLFFDAGPGLRSIATTALSFAILAATRHPFPPSTLPFLLATGHPFPRHPLPLSVSLIVVLLLSAIVTVT